MSKNCGDFGGTTQSGDPCRRDAGWGRSGVNTGPCKDHVKEAQPDSVTGRSNRDINTNRAGDPLLGREDIDKQSQDQDDLFLEFLRHFYKSDDSLVQERQNWIIYGIFDSYILGIHHGFDEFTDLWTRFVNKRDERSSLRQICQGSLSSLDRSKRNQLSLLAMVMLLVDDRRTNFDDSLVQLSNLLNVEVTIPLPVERPSQSQPLSGRGADETSSEAISETSKQIESCLDAHESGAYITELYEAIYGEITNSKEMSPAVTIQQLTSLEFALNLSRALPPGWSASSALFAESNECIRDEIERFVEVRNQWPKRSDPSSWFVEYLPGDTYSIVDRMTSRFTNGSGMIFILALIVVLILLIWFIL